VGRRVATQSRIRTILVGQGLSAPRGKDTLPEPAS
jgi:hypothetical protein